MADPEIHKHVEVTEQLVTLLGVAKTDQVQMPVPHCLSNLLSAMYLCAINILQ